MFRIAFALLSGLVAAVTGGLAGGCRDCHPNLAQWLTCDNVQIPPLSPLSPPPPATTQPPPPPPATTPPPQQWKRGLTTYYTSNEGGARGAGGLKLTPFRSVAVRIGDFRKYEGRRVEFKGIGTFVVEDGCAGGACKDFDIYVGHDVSAAKRIPNWQAGNIPIEYRWIV